MKKKNFRKRSIDEAREDLVPNNKSDSEDDQEARLKLEEVKFLQKRREKKSGISAVPLTAQAFGASNGSTSALIRRGNEKTDGDGEEDLVLQDTFAQETAIMDEDPNMLRYVEQELAKKRGRNINVENGLENDVKCAEDELYEIPEHLRVKRRNSEESSTQWTTGIAEVQLPMEYKLRNIEETEAAKKLLQEKRLLVHPKTDPNIRFSYRADYFQRGKDYAEKLRRDHPELYKDKDVLEKSSEYNRAVESGKEGTGAAQRQAATDEFMLERFRRRERHRVMRR